jgi:pimeloyl-ACP methyl ester carboxylesterase
LTTGSLRRRDFLLSTLPAITVALSGGAARASETILSLDGLDVTVWRPEGSMLPATLPILIFSHGFHGCATQSRFLMAAFAVSGYLVFALDHRDATCNGGNGRWIDRPEERFGKSADWDETTFRDRADDVRRLIAALKDDTEWQNRIDWQRFALVGHSLGGYTALGLAGAWPGWKLDGIKAVLALSPYVEPFVVRQTLGGLAAPVMYQGGTLDFDVTPWLSKAMGAYDLSPRPKFYVEMARAGHFAWTDLGIVDRNAIIAYSLAFLDRYLLRTAPSPLLTHATPDVTMMRYAT